MRATGATTVKQLLDGSVFPDDATFKKLRLLQRLQASISFHIDPEMLKHIQVTNYHNQTISLHTDSAALATRLRYSVPDILASIQRTPFPVPVKSIRVLVNPSSTSKTDKPANHFTMSESTSTYLQQVADTIDDAEIKGRLRRLSLNSSVK